MVFWADSNSKKYYSRKKNFICLLFDSFRSKSLSEYKIKYNLHVIFLFLRSTFDLSILKNLVKLFK